MVSGRISTAPNVASYNPAARSLYPCGILKLPWALSRSPRGVVARTISAPVNELRLVASSTIGLNICGVIDNTAQSPISSPNSLLLANWIGNVFSTTIVVKSPISPAVSLVPLAVRYKLAAICHIALPIP